MIHCVPNSLPAGFLRLTKSLHECAVRALWGPSTGPTGKARNPGSTAKGRVWICLAAERVFASPKNAEHLR